MASDALSDDQEPTRGPIQAEVVDRHIRAALAERVRSMIPARVDKVHTDGSGNLLRVDCKILVGDFHRDETGALVTSSVPIINSVPVVFLTAGGFTVTAPVQGGTLGMLFFSDRSMDRWLSGQGQEVVDPELYHRSALTDAVFLPGLLPFGAPSGYAPTDRASFGEADAAGGLVQIDTSGAVTVKARAAGSAGVAINSGATGNVVVNGDGVTDQQVALATLDTAGPYPIVASSPRRFKAGAT